MKRHLIYNLSEKNEVSRQLLIRTKKKLTLSQSDPATSKRALKTFVTRGAFGAQEIVGAPQRYLTALRAP
jgi:hypothetical protein